jgi:hypothetical protein
MFWPGAGVDHVVALAAEDDVVGGVVGDEIALAEISPSEDALHEVQVPRPASPVSTWPK